MERYYNLLKISDDEALMPDSGKGTSGGTVTMLWNHKVGPVFAATMAEYKMAEPRNMQYARNNNSMPCGSLRICDGAYTSVNNGRARVTVEETENFVRAEAAGSLRNAALEENNTGYKLDYIFENDRITVKAQADKDCKLMLPVICSHNDAVTVTGDGIEIHRSNAWIKLSSEQPLLIEGSASIRNFHVIGGFQTLSVYVGLRAGVESKVVLKISDI